jgi:trans-L-3-hydroxyproline dehydratase
MHNDGYSTMCGHGIIAITKVVIETGLIAKIEPSTTIKIDTPAGLVTATANINNGKVQGVSFQNVPSYVVALDSEVEIDGIGRFKYDLAFGGAYYAYVQAKDVGLTCFTKDVNEFIQIGKKIKKAISESVTIKHPYDDNLSFLYGTIFIDGPKDENNHSRNICIFADGEVDRSPTGTGVSGRLAIHYARNEIAIDTPISIESIIGTKFIGRVIRETNFGDYNAIVPEVSGTAFIVGKNEFCIDPNDKNKNGIFIR